MDVQLTPDVEVIVLFRLASNIGSLTGVSAGILHLGTVDLTIRETPRRSQLGLFTTQSRLN